MQVRSRAELVLPELERQLREAFSPDLLETFARIFKGEEAFGVRPWTSGLSAGWNPVSTACRTASFRSARTLSNQTRFQKGPEPVDARARLAHFRRPGYSPATLTGRSAWLATSPGTSWCSIRPSGERESSSCPNWKSREHPPGPGLNAQFDELFHHAKTVHARLSDDL